MPPTSFVLYSLAVPTAWPAAFLIAECFRLASFSPQRVPTSSRRLAPQGSTMEFFLTEMPSGSRSLFRTV